MTNKEYLINKVFDVSNELLSDVLSRNKNKCEFCINTIKGSCKVSDCQPGIKQWLESEYTENKKIYKILKIDFKKMNFSEWQTPKETKNE